MYQKKIAPESLLNTVSRNSIFKGKAHVDRFGENNDMPVLKHDD